MFTFHRSAESKASLCNMVWHWLSWKLHCCCKTWRCSGQDLRNYLDWIFNYYYVLIYQGRIQNLHCRGAQVTNEAEGFTEARCAERGRVGEGVTPSRRWGYGGPPPEIFWEIASKWCILSAFWGNQYTFFALKFIWKKCVSLNLHKTRQDKTIFIGTNATTMVGKGPYTITYITKIWQS